MPGAVALAALTLGCGPIVDPSPRTDPCGAPPPALALGAAVTGTLDPATDCFQLDGRLGDDYLLTLEAPTLFTITLESEGFLPFIPTYRDGIQASGWASDSAHTLTREHLFPAGAVTVRASSLEQSTTPAAAARGSYTLSTAVLAVPQEKCGRETSVTYGSVAEGRLVPDDCERAWEDDPDTPRPADGYSTILEAARTMTVTVTADFRFRVLHAPDGAEGRAWTDVPAGDSVVVTAAGAGFHDFWISGEAADAGGGYVLRFEPAGAAGAVTAAGAVHELCGCAAAVRRATMGQRPPTFVRAPRTGSSVPAASGGTIRPTETPSRKVNMDQAPLQNERLSAPEPALPSLTPPLLAGLGAAVLGGAAWAVLTAVTGYEIGYAAWALGGLVGFGMTRTTTRRDRVAGAAAAALALGGLVVARVIIAEFVLVGTTVEEIAADDDLMAQAAAVDMRFNETFPPDLQARYDAVPEGDTLSDALWTEMLAAGAQRLEELSDDDREALAGQFASLVLGQTTLTNRVTAQLGPFDLLWIFLAVSTAWGMMTKREEEAGLGTETA
ncbi:MAG TPA: hypothetical protein VK849_03765 [Longimicrobiales bacterium]|nr:hypothetical protein [Longimicrobiales bacterium]